jgi:hypothetical protein
VLLEFAVDTALSDSSGKMIEMITLLLLYLVINSDDGMISDNSRSTRLKVPLDNFAPVITKMNTQ